MVLCKKPPKGGFFIWSITERSEGYDRGGPWRCRPDDDLSASCLAIAGVACNLLETSLFALSDRLSGFLGVGVVGDDRHDRINLRGCRMDEVEGIGEEGVCHGLYGIHRVGLEEEAIVGGHSAFYRILRGVERVFFRGTTVDVIPVATHF